MRRRSCPLSASAKPQEWRSVCGCTLSRAVEVEFVAAQAHGLADAQAVAVGHQQQKVVAHPVPAGLGSIEQPSHLGWRQVILGPLVPVGGFDSADWPTLDLLPVGRLHRHCRNPLLAREAG